MKIKIKDINNANKITITFEFFREHKIVIDKNQNLIEENGVDITQECLKILNEYTIGDIVVESPYKGGMVLALILQGKANGKCLKYLKAIADNIVLE